MINRKCSEYVRWLFVFFISNLFLVQPSYGLLPVKGSDSLGSYEGVHRAIASENVSFFSAKLSEKLKVIDGLSKSLSNVIVGIKGQIKAYRDSISRLNELYMENSAISKKKYEASIEQLQNKGKDINDQIEKLLGSKDNLLECDDKTRTSILEEYKNKLVDQMVDGINRGDYSFLLSSLPACLFLPAHVPNTFTCAFTLKFDDLSTDDVYVKKDKKVFVVTRDSSESFVFESGDTNEDFFVTSMSAQVAALSGEISVAKVKKINNTPLDLFRHSEQKSFNGLGVLEFVDSFVKDVNKRVVEIIYHGNTIRDMCPNCRATLVAHEMLTIKNNMEDSVLPDSFLCVLQNGCFDRFKMKPIITCLISSFFEYSNRADDITWNKKVNINLLNLSEKSPEGVCSSFLNQFAFSEKDFLEILCNINSSSCMSGTEQVVKNALELRKKALFNRRI